MLPPVIRHRGRIAAVSATIITAGLTAGLALTAVKSTPTTLPISAATPAAATTSPAQGIDVSSLQHMSGATINWQSVAGSGVTFTGIKATEANYYTNSYYQSDMQQAVANGLYVIPYVFANPYQGADINPPPANGTAAQQADDAWGVISNATDPAYSSSSRMLPLAVDLEPDPYVSTETNSNECYGLNTGQMVTWIKAFIDEAKTDTGKTPIIYTSASWWSTCTANSIAFGADPLWVADYGVSSPAIPAGWSHYTFWQNSDSGTVSGVSGPVDVDLHAPITLTVSNRSGTAGTPISLNTPASDPDTGYTPTLTASGLPPGLSMNSSGLITGWPYVPGTYTVKVSASDALDGTGSASFTWTINAAPNSGATGQIRQVGDTGKCIEDPGSKTANGSPIELWTCGTSSNQKWTVAQDSTMRVLGKCLDMAGTGTATDTALRLWTCNSGDGAQQWQAGSDGELINPRSGKCVYIGTDSAGNGAKPTVHACGNDARHHWLRPAGSVLSGLPGRCLTTSGSIAELVTCANVAAQHWTAQINGTIVQSGKCLIEGGTTAGSAVSFGTCSSASDQWKVISANRIAVELSNPASGLCVSVPTNSTASGTPLKMETCGNNPYSTWDFE